MGDSQQSLQIGSSVQLSWPGTSETWGMWAETVEGECKGSMAEDDKRKQNRNKLQMENAVALRQSPVDFGS